MKRFNTTGVCIPEKHYMVDLSERVRQIRKMTDDGKYFVINRARQYGKTTLLHALEREIARDYTVISMDFQALGKERFSSERRFVSGISKYILKKESAGALLVPDKAVAQLRMFENSPDTEIFLDDLFDVFADWCNNPEKPVVLIIDEVDAASGTQTFLDFLAQLRLQYLEKEKNSGYPAFQSVILAGVSDIRHVKSKIRPEDRETVNSPWNIAADFPIRMSFDQKDIEGMLSAYEEDYHTGMDMDIIAGLIVDYTSGYPFLVSRICQLIDENNANNYEQEKKIFWTKNSVVKAVQEIVSESNALFESLSGRLENNPVLKDVLRRILFSGEAVSFNKLQEEFVQLELLGIIEEDENTIRIANRIYETVLYQYLLSDADVKNSTTIICRKDIC